MVFGWCSGVIKILFLSIQYPKFNQKITQVLQKIIAPSYLKVPHVVLHSY
jgi:hypothetical protein